MTVPPKDFLTEERLAVYGSLRPGEKNAHLLAPLEGRWSEGFVLGALRPIPAGYAKGYTGITLTDDGDRVPVAMLSSRDLPAFWPRLDEFEGADFVRTIVQVRIGESLIEANLYEWRP